MLHLSSKKETFSVKAKTTGTKDFKKRVIWSRSTKTPWTKDCRSLRSWRESTLTRNMASLRSVSIRTQNSKNRRLSKASFGTITDQFLQSQVGKLLIIPQFQRLATILFKTSNLDVISHLLMKERSVNSSNCLPITTGSSTHWRDLKIFHNWNNQNENAI